MANLNDLIQFVPQQASLIFSIGNSPTQVSSSSLSSALSVTAFLDPKEETFELQRTIGLVADQLISKGLGVDFVIRIITKELFSGGSAKKDLSRMISQQLKEMISRYPQTELLTYKATLVAAFERLELADLFEVLLLKDSLGKHLSSDTIIELLPRTLSLDAVIEFLATTIPQHSFTAEEENNPFPHIESLLYMPDDEIEGNETETLEPTIPENSLPLPPIEEENNFLSSHERLTPNDETESLVNFQTQHDREHDQKIKMLEIISALIDRAISSLESTTTPEESTALSSKICRLLKMRDKNNYPCCYTITSLELIRRLFELLEFKELKEIMLTSVPGYEDIGCFFEAISGEFWMTILELKVLQGSIIGSKALQDRARCVVDTLSTVMPTVIPQMVCSYLSETLSDQLFELLTLRNNLTGNYLFHFQLRNINLIFRQTTILPFLRTPNVLGDYVVHYCLKDSKGKHSVAHHQVVGQMMYDLNIHEGLEILQLKDGKNKSLIHYFPADSNWTVEPETPIVVNSAQVKDMSLIEFATFLSNLCSSIVENREVSSQQLATFLNTTGMDPSGNTILGIIINYSQINVSYDFDLSIFEILNKLDTSDLNTTLTKLMELSRLKISIDLQTFFMNNERNAARALKKVSQEVQESIFKIYPELRSLLDKDFDAPIDMGEDEGDDIPAETE